MGTGTAKAITIGLCFFAAAALAEVPQRAMTLRAVHDPGRNQIWLLQRDAVYLHDATSHMLKARFELPGWIYASEPYACAPDLAIDAQGAAVVSSNVVPRLWRIDPLKSEVTKHELALDADADRDVGFSALVFMPEQGTFFGASSTYGSVWRIDPTLRRAQKIALSVSVRGACGLALERTKTRRTLVLCAFGTDGG